MQFLYTNCFQNYHFKEGINIGQPSYMFLCAFANIGATKYANILCF